MARRRLAEDPLSADRRTLAIAAVTMVALIGVGVVSAALFTRSACDDLRPAAVEPPAASGDLRTVIDAAFGDLDDAARDEIVDGVSELAGRLGPVVGISQVGDAHRLVVLPSGPASFGPTTSVLDPDGGGIRASGVFDAPAVLAGDGDTLYALALVNELTGQVDAVQPFDVDLEPVGACLDAATVNIPFAFYLDANAGQLLLFRAEEDGDDPELELRDRRGAIWRAPVEVTTAPPGLMGERLSSLLGEEFVVAARRSVPGEDAAAVMAVSRQDGAVQWTVAPDELPLEGEPTWIDVVAIGPDVVLLTLGADEAPERSRLAAIDASDGSLRWVEDEPVERVLTVAAEGRVFDVLRVDEQVEVHDVDALSGDRIVVGDGLAMAARGSVGQDVALFAFGDAGLLVVDGSEVDVERPGAAVTDVAVDGDGRTFVLLADGQEAIMVTFGAS